MSIYRYITNPFGIDTSVSKEKFEDIDDAVKAAIPIACGMDFMIVEEMRWQARQDYSQPDPDEVEDDD